MSMNTTFKTYGELIEYLSSVDYPQCFTVNYLPDSSEYELWIGNQPYYVYDKWIEEEEQKVRDLKKENLVLKGDIVDLQKQNEYWRTNYYVKEELSLKLTDELEQTEQKLDAMFKMVLDEESN